MQLKSWISDGLWRNNLANDNDRDALINSSSSSAGMFYEWPASDGVNTNLYTSINKRPDMAVYSRLIVNLTKNRVKYSATKIAGLLQRSKNKCKLIFLHCNKESNCKLKLTHKIKTYTRHTVELINSNQATYIFSLVTIISHGKQTPLRGNLWRDWSSTNKKKMFYLALFSGVMEVLLSTTCLQDVLRGRPWIILPIGSKGLQIPFSGNTANGRRFKRALNTPITS